MAALSGQEIHEAELKDSQISKEKLQPCLG